MGGKEKLLMGPMGLAGCERALGAQWEAVEGPQWEADAAPC